MVQNTLYLFKIRFKYIPLTMYQPIEDNTTKELYKDYEIMDASIPAYEPYFQIWR